MERTLDQILAYHCAPALAGLKPANLVALSREEFPGSSHPVITKEVYLP